MNVTRIMFKGNEVYYFRIERHLLNTISLERVRKYYSSETCVLTKTKTGSYRRLDGTIFLHDGGSLRQIGGAIKDFYIRQTLNDIGL